MSLMPARRRASTIGLAGARDRLVPADHHHGPYPEFLRRHEQEAQQAALGTKHDREEFSRCLLPRAGDPRNVMLAIEHCASHGQAAGPNGLRPTDLDRQARWDMAHTLSPLIRTGQYHPGKIRTEWISKGKGRGQRPIRIQNFEDRAVERAVLQVIRPLLQHQYLDCSYGYRYPGRSRELALAIAAETALTQGRFLWLSQDLKDAFEHIPRTRLIQIIHRMLPANNICVFIERLISQDQLRGIRQGGCLSPEMLNAYLHWLLDRWWMRRFPGIPMFRVADDLLAVLLEAELEEVNAELEQQCRSIGMPLKFTRANCTYDLMAGQRTEWLGYSVCHSGSGLVMGFAQKAWDKLEEHLWACWEDAVPSLSARETILGWIGQYGAAYRREIILPTYTRIAEIARSQGFDEIPGREEIASRWHQAHLRDWLRVRQELSLGGNLCLAEGSADQHRENASTCARRDPERPEGAPPQIAPARREVYLYCDGSCLEPGGRGGWAYLMAEPETGFRRTDAGAHPKTTNNRMELTAVIRGLASLPDSCRVHLVVDSEYVSRGITEWLPRWMANGWRAGGRRARRLQNKQLWQQLVEQLQRHDVDCQWVRSHAGHAENELVDGMAREAAIHHENLED